MADSAEWKAVKPTGLAAAILGVTIIFTILCVVVVGLRVNARVVSKVFGLEDWLMCIGFVINMVHNGIVIWGAFTGIGTYDSELNAATMMEGAKTIVFWQIFYVSGSVFIKASICATIVRIGTQRRYIYLSWGLVALSAVTTVIAIAAVLIRCKPVEASWNPALGTCIDQSIIISLTYAVSSVNIVTDLSVAIIPGLIIWNLQMRKSLKKMIALILGLGALASIATIIRLPYTSAYSNNTNLLHNIGNIIIWTVVECSLGIIAGSMPMLRIYFTKFAKDESSHQQGSRDLNLMTIGRVKGRHHPSHDADLLVTAVCGDDHESANDDESIKHIIRVTRRIDQVSTKGYEQV